jgi:ATP-binding cassette subfamily F protein 3
MLHITDISKSFGSQVLFDEASLHIKPGMRVGLIGPNGSGKTTLMRMIVGEMSLDEGQITYRKGLRIGFLPQEIEEIADHAVMDEVLASHIEVLTAEHRIADLGHQISEAYAVIAAGGTTSADPEKLLEELGALQTAFEDVHGYELESRAQSILRGMGFRDTDFERPIVELSGGWRMRVALSRLLLEQPDLLLMDEPTNHLDLESLIWLEDFLLNWTGALVVISHDRYFLNRMVTHIADLDMGMIDLYSGNYDHFEEEKRERYDALVSAARNQQREIDSAEAFIRRFRAKNTKAKQVQQKIRKLEKTERIDAPTLDRKTIRFRFPQPPRTGRVVAEIKHVRKAYGENIVYKKLDAVIERGEKIALVGHNGAGKSTLLKLLAGVTEADAGSLILGHNVRREYFAQHQLEVMNAGRTVLKTMEEIAGPAGRMPEVRSYLGTFLFGEDDVTKKVGVLSGGEKARLALARMLMDPAGLLLLDEPTNHLDMDSRAVLTEALRQFEGSVVFISHDRHLINAIGTKVVEVKDGQLVSYPGDWEYYLWKKAQEADPSQKAAAPSPAPNIAAAEAPAGSKKSAAPANARTVELGYQERKELSSRHRKVEKLIMEAEARQTELAATMSDSAHATDYEVLSKASSEAAEVAAELTALYEEWGKLGEALGTTAD